MKPFNEIAGFNLLAILLYSLTIRLFTLNDVSARALISAVVIGLHVFVCLLVALGFSSSKKGHARAWLASAGIVLLVGFSACYGNTML